MKEEIFLVLKFVDKNDKCEVFIAYISDTDTVLIGFIMGLTIERISNKD